MGSAADVVYRVDGADTLRYVNGAWDEFARANGAPHLISDRVLGRSLWDFIADESTRQLYASIMAVARRSRLVRFTVRCDAPELRRLLEVTVRSAGNGAVEFRTHQLSGEARHPQPLLDPARPHSDKLVTVCSWCMRVAVPGGWAEVEDAVGRLALFERPALPVITHGMCGDCLTRMLAESGLPDDLSGADG